MQHPGCRREERLGEAQISDSEVLGAGHRGGTGDAGIHVALRGYGLFGDPLDRKFILVGFLLLWPSPWLFLRREERAELGWVGPAHARGGRCRRQVAALACFGSSFALYGDWAPNPSSVSAAAS